ncbi:MAG TPA: hypothetical protein VD713_07790 [Sphingomonadales bacterium]|nr:hypothetical protein [Sphingomonadales bacterium]
MAASAENPISFVRFQALVGAYGADSRRWPALEREAALSFAAGDLRAKALLDAAKALDQALSILPVPTDADAALLKRLATIPHAQAQPAPARVRLKWLPAFTAALGVRSFVPQGIAIAAAGVVGIWLGLAAGVPDSEVAVDLADSTYFAFNPDLEKDLGEAR